MSPATATLSKMAATAAIEPSSIFYPPPYENRDATFPSLLISWWATWFAAIIIIVRVCGRYIRSEILFREDKVMLASLIPLFIRLAFVHFVLLWQTNNVQVGNLTESDIYHRSIGSRLVLASRIFYAMFIWVAKFTVSEFLKRLTETTWNKYHEWILQAIRVFLALTFIGVVFGTLLECSPFHEYWQVVPLAPPGCRDGYVQLLVMGISDIVTDILLIIFPIPIVLRAHMPISKRLLLCLLFSLSGFNIAVTAYRIPAIIDSHFKQQLRSLWASYEILIAAMVTNALVLGSFVRDRGVKKSKRKYRHQSLATTSDEPSINRTMTKAHWGSDSDENLFRTINGRMNSLSHHQDESEEFLELTSYKASAFESSRTKTPQELAVSTHRIERASATSSSEGDSSGMGVVQYEGSYYDNISAPGSGHAKQSYDHEEGISPTTTNTEWNQTRNRPTDVSLNPPWTPGAAPGPDDLTLYDVGGILESGPDSTTSRDLAIPKSPLGGPEDAPESSTASSLRSFYLQNLHPTSVLAQDFAVPSSSGKAYAFDGYSDGFRDPALDHNRTRSPLATRVGRTKVANRLHHTFSPQRHLSPSSPFRRSEERGGALSPIADDGPSSPALPPTSAPSSQGYFAKKSKKTTKSVSLPKPGELQDPGGLLD